MGVSTQARSPMEIGTEMKSVMYAVPEKNENHVWKSQVRFFCAMEVSTERTLQWYKMEYAV